MSEDKKKEVNQKQDELTKLELQAWRQADEIEAKVRKIQVIEGHVKELEITMNEKDR